MLSENNHHRLVKIRQEKKDIAEKVAALVIDKIETMAWKKEVNEYIELTDNNNPNFRSSWFHEVIIDYISNINKSPVIIRCSYSPNGSKYGARWLLSVGYSDFIYIDKYADNRTQVRSILGDQDDHCNNELSDYCGFPLDSFFVKEDEVIKHYKDGNNDGLILCDLGKGNFQEFYYKDRYSAYEYANGDAWADSLRLKLENRIKSSEVTDAQKSLNELKKVFRQISEN